MVQGKDGTAESLDFESHIELKQLAPVSLI